MDKVQVSIKAGDGGNGALSFRREKYVDKGGPDGGDGGNGADVRLVASNNQNTLAAFRYHKEIVAPSGAGGDKRRRHGKSGEDLVVAVPVGTAVMDADGQTLADLTRDGQSSVIAKGGKGGYGNAHFISSTRQAPRIAEKGEPGEQLEVTFELKMIADVGLVGLPNAGKSTLLSVLSNARPDIADYPFTTLTPNLGVVDIDKNHSLLLADIPGLIEGAAKGKGLGVEFLRHIERTLVLVHLIDAYQEDVAAAYRTIQSELKAYKVDLSKRPQIVVLNKTEGLDEDITEDLIKQLRSVVPARTPIMSISAQAKQGLATLLKRLVMVADKEGRRAQAKQKKTPVLPVIRLTPNANEWQIEKQGQRFLVTGSKIERFAARTDFTNPEAVNRLRDIMRKTGIMRELVRHGAKPGSKVVIGTAGELNY